MSSQYQRSYGSKYNGALTNKEIAVAIRADIKAAIAANELPRGTYSVTLSRGRGIDVRVKAFEFPILNPERLAIEGTPDDTYANERRVPLYTPIARLALDKLQSIMDAYNHDGSDIQTDYFDVKFYGQACMAWQLESAERDAYKATKAGQ